MGDNWQFGEIESLSGTFVVTWDHRENNGELRYRVYERELEQHYVCRYDDGWRIAPRGHTTVDLERFIPEDDDLCMELIHTLNRADGRVRVGGIHVISDNGGA